MKEDFNFFKKYIPNDDSRIIIIQGNMEDLGNFLIHMFNEFQEKCLTKQAKNIPKSKQFTISEYENNPILRLGSNGQHVFQLQELLKKLLYYSGEIDGKYGQKTKNAVKRLQADNYLNADGIVGNDTWCVLYSLYNNQIMPMDEIDETYFLYVVKKGDTLWSISRRYDTTVEILKKLNGLNSDLLQIGQILKVPNNDIDYNL